MGESMAWIAFIMVIIKILFDIIIFIIKKVNQREVILLNAEGVRCKHLQKTDVTYVCTNFLFKRKMLNGVCPREKCLGFYMGQMSNDDNEIINSSVFFFCKKVIDSFPEIAAALLALNEIISK